MRRKYSLAIAKSKLPGAGKGLFTKDFIRKGSRIAEYKGKVYTWKEVEKLPDHRNSYIFYFNSRHVIDAWKTKKSLAHFANDARGLTRVPGLSNNSEYVIDGKRAFIEATRDISEGSEIFVDYGREYWQAVRYNLRQRESRRKGKRPVERRIARRKASH